MNDLSDNSLQQIRTIVREEVEPIKEEIKTIKLAQGNQSIMLGEVRADVRNLKNGFRSQTRELHKLGVLFEDLDDRFQAASEIG